MLIVINQYMLIVINLNSSTDLNYLVYSINNQSINQ